MIQCSNLAVLCYFPQEIQASIPKAHVPTSSLLPKMSGEKQKKASQNADFIIEDFNLLKMVTSGYSVQGKCY